MGKNNMKNIVVLKNLPSNLIDEAFVILKNNSVAREFEYADKSGKSRKLNKDNKKDYIIKEAESVLASYIEKIENKSKQTNKKKFNIKYKSLKIYSVIISFLFALMLLIKF